MSFFKNFEIIVIGAGHSGIEATHIAAEMGCKVGLITMPNVPIASTPCNPSVGGLAKGQVVREIDALGGIMGLISDSAGIQYRTLNDSKGYAVQSTRVQVDKNLYSEKAKKILEEHPNIEIIYKKISGIEKNEDLFILQSSCGEKFSSKKLIITTGTFLNGKLHFGEEQIKGGRVSSESSNGLNSLFGKLKFLSLRFKTGTPPRILKKSINFGKLEKQPSDPKTRNFSYRNSAYERKVEQMDCFLTKTNSQSMGIIRSNRELSPLFNGQIEGIGPRYCPSIEDKAFRYPDRDIHHIFVEPEGLDLETYYPSGLSTSLPKEIQYDFIRKIEGLENAEIAIPGYAVEYDVIDTTTLFSTLESKDISGLYFAGQVNGTSGYEEAAGQGIVAGISAARSFLGHSEMVFDRYSSYIGIMVDDLVSNKRDEPYRLFTSRSENRLFLREDNSLLRMAEFRRKLQINGSYDKFLNSFVEEFEFLNSLILSFPNIEEALKQSSVDPVAYLSSVCEKNRLFFNFDVIKTVAIESKYKGYIKRGEEQLLRMKNLDNKKINWEEIIKSSNVSFECKLRIKTVRPATFGQLRLVEGVRQATLAVVAGSLH